MKKHTYLFFLSCVLSLSLLAGSLFYGENVKASSPIFYDSKFTFYAADYSTYGSTGDFSYSSKEIDRTFSGSGFLYNNLGAYLASFNQSNPVDNTGFRITISSPELMLNGGYVYLAYNFAFYKFGSYDYSRYEEGLTNTTLNQSYVGFGNPGSVYITDSLLTNYRSFEFSYFQNSNTSLNNESYYEIENGLVYGFDRYDGGNLPVGIGMLEQGSTSQLLESYGLSSSKFYNYGRPGDSWWKSSVYMLKIKVDPLPPNYNNYELVVYPSNSLSIARYLSYLYNTTIEIGDESESVRLRYIPKIFICPVFCYCVSSSSYQPIQQLLSDLKGDTSAMTYYLFLLSQSTSSEQQAWLNEYQRKSQDAIAKASSMAAAAHYEFSKPDINSGDLSQYINGTEVRPFTTLLSSFLSHSKILIILTVAITASIIGYIFFGKRG